MIALIQEYADSLKTKDPSGSSEEYQNTLNILNILRKWKEMGMIQWEFGGMDTRAETLSVPDNTGRRGIRSRCKPYYIMLNWTSLGTRLGDLRLKEGSAEYADHLLKWSALRLFHEGYHLLDERIHGFGYTLPEEIAAWRAEVGFYKFLRAKGYTEKDLDEAAAMNNEQLAGKLRSPTTYMSLPTSREGNYDRARIFPKIPPLLPKPGAPGP